MLRRSIVQRHHVRAVSCSHSASRFLVRNHCGTHVALPWGEDILMEGVFRHKDGSMSRTNIVGRHDITPQPVSVPVAAAETPRCPRHLSARC
jgi:hypothetical protein